ncbi:MAG: pyridoxal-phosphate dependent enzyme [Desulfobacterales bacterium]|nr:pyridoxal-phosphate dependent enzyme [Desulfobacterales bacterium]
MSRRPALFDAWPELAETLPWIALGDTPTPVAPLPHMDCGDLWIKRDDLSSSIYGGNKVRKLEFILAEAKTKGKRRVVTMGGIGTNHGLATAAFCRQLGLDCVLLLFDQPVTHCVKDNLRLFHHFGARVLPRGSFSQTLLAFFLWHRILHPFDYFVYPGGSSVTGTLGFVSGGLELAAQVAEGALPEPAELFCPVGSGGTMAGLMVGLALAGLRTRVVGVRVTQSRWGPVHVCTPQSVAKLAQNTLKFLKKKVPGLPAVALPPVRLLDAYAGPGYGVPTLPGQQAAQALMDREGIALDPCYTAKAFAAVLDHCRGKTNGPVLYWHTYNGLDLSELACTVPEAGLPEKLRCCLAADEAVPCSGGVRLASGMCAPGFSFDTPWETGIGFDDATGSGPAVLFFLRYTGCPLCQMRVVEIRRDSRLWRDMGATVFVLLQSRAESVASLVSREAESFVPVCDPDGDLFSLYGVAPGGLHQYLAPSVLKKALTAMTKGYRHGKREGRELQLPAVFVLQGDRRIRLAHYGNNIDDLPDNRIITDCLASMKNEKA